MKPAGNKLKSIVNILVGLAALLQVLLVFFMERRFAFLLEDTDYLLNLKTGESLNNIGDIIEGIPYVLSGRGGSIFSIALLQFVMLQGELFADILNTCILLLISYLIGKLANAKKDELLFYVTPFFMLISLNSDWQFSYLWEFAIVNFVYPAIPLLVYLLIVKCSFEKTEDRIPVWKGVLAAISAFFAGWMNASYGLIAIFVSVLSILIETKIIKRNVFKRYIVSAVSGFIGVALYMAASGNFSSESVINGIYISFSIFPGVVLALLLLAIMLRSGGWLSAMQIILIVTLGFSIALRFIIGWLPGITENGIQICCLIISIALFCSLLQTMKKEFPKHRIWPYLVSLCSFLYSIFTLLESMGGVG